MFTICVVLIASLFVCTSCELFKDKPLKINYVTSDRLNMLIFLNNIPRDAVEYRFKRVGVGNDVTVIQHGTLDANSWSIYVNTIVTTNRNYFVELLQADGSLCSLRDAVHLIADEYAWLKQEDPDCLNPKQPCVIYVDYKTSCDDTFIDISVSSPRGHENINFEKYEDQTVYFNENDKIELMCRRRGTPASSNSTLTWHNIIGKDNEFLIGEGWWVTNTSFLLEITLWRFDDNTTVYCTGQEHEISSRITFKLNKTQTGVKEIKKVYYNKPAVYDCPTGEYLFREVSNGNIIFHRYGSTQIYGRDNGTMFYCMAYIYYGYNENSNIIKFVRRLHEEVMYIYVHYVR